MMMKSLIASTVLVLMPALAVAQASGTKAADKPAAKTATKSTSAAKAKSETKQVAKAQPTSSRTQLKSAATQVATGISAAEAALSPAELAIAERVHTGRIACELGAFVNVARDDAAPGHFNIEGKGFKYRMVPVATTTGAVRLEDQKGGAVWLQIANKSMLMDQKRGQRLADECMSAEQTQVAEAIKKNPPPSVFDHQPSK